jgi:hypothetical protein
MTPQKGDLIELIEMVNDPDPIERGTKGVIDFVSDYSLSVRWETGRTLGVVPGVDLYKITHSPGNTGVYLVESEGNQICITIMKSFLEEKLKLLGLIIEDLEIKSHKLNGESHGALSFFLRSLRLNGEIKTHEINYTVDLLSGIDKTLPELIFYYSVESFRFSITYLVGLPNVVFEIK